MFTRIEAYEKPINIVRWRSANEISRNPYSTEAVEPINKKLLKDLRTQKQFKHLY